MRIITRPTICVQTRAGFLFMYSAATRFVTYSTDVMVARFSSLRLFTETYPEIISELIDDEKLRLF